VAYVFDSMHLQKNRAHLIVASLQCLGSQWYRRAQIKARSSVTSSCGEAFSGASLQDDVFAFV